MARRLLNRGYERGCKAMEWLAVGGKRGGGVRYDGGPPEDDTGVGEGSTGATRTEAGAGQGGQNGGGEVAEGGGGTTATAGTAGDGYVPYCGGCATQYFVRCARQEVLIQALPHDELMSVAERACGVAQSALSHAEGGAGGQGGADPRSGEGELWVVLERGAPAPEGDWCQSYVDLPRVDFDDPGCRGWDDEDRVGERTVRGECCVIIEHNFCDV